MSTTLFEILEEQLVEAQRQEDYQPSAGLKKLIDVSATHPKVVRKKRAKHVNKKRRRLAK